MFKELSSVAKRWRVSIRELFTPLPSLDAQFDRFEAELVKLPPQDRARAIRRLSQASRRASFIGFNK